MVIRKLKWLWLIVNWISCRPILSIIILVINKSDRMITDQIGLHSVLLPLFMERGGGKSGKFQRNTTRFPRSCAPPTFAVVRFCWSLVRFQTKLDSIWFYYHHLWKGEGGNQENETLRLPDSPDLAPPPPHLPPFHQVKKNFSSSKQNSQIKLTHGRSAFWFSLSSPWTQLTQLTVVPLRTDRRTTRSTSACIHLSLDKVFFWLAIHSLCSFSLKSFALGFWSSFSCLTIRITSSEPIVAPYMWYQKRIQKDRPSSLRRSMALSFAFLGLDVSI